MAPAHTRNPAPPPQQNQNPPPQQRQYGSNLPQYQSNQNNYNNYGGANNNTTYQNRNIYADPYSNLPEHVTPDTPLKDCDNIFLACLCPPCMMYAHEGEFNCSVCLNLVTTFICWPCGSCTAMLHANWLNENEIER